MRHEFNQASKLAICAFSTSHGRVHLCFLLFCNIKHRQIHIKEHGPDRLLGLWKKNTRLVIDDSTQEKEILGYAEYVCGKEAALGNTMTQPCNHLL